MHWSYGYSLPILQSHDTGENHGPVLQAGTQYHFTCTGRDVFSNLEDKQDGHHTLIKGILILVHSPSFNSPWKMMVGKWSPESFWGLFWPIFRVTPLLSFQESYYYWGLLFPLMMMMMMMMMMIFGDLWRWAVWTWIQTVELTVFGSKFGL